MLKLFPENVMAAEWNREMTHKGISAAGREFIVESLTKMGCPEKIEEIVCVADMMDFDEGRIPGYDVEKAIALGTD